MPRWGRVLTTTAIHEPALRSDYRIAARVFARRILAHYTAVRLLLAPPLQPHAVAAYGFLAHTDDLADQGPVSDRLPCFQAWAEQVTSGLDNGHAQEPVLRAFLHTVTTRQLPHHWVTSYVQGTAAELHFAGFSTEADFQRYVDDVALPALMLLEDLQHPGGGDNTFRERCRLLAEGLQRLDHLTDITEDLAQGRLYLPQEDLDRCGVTRAALEQGEDTPATRALITLTCQKTRKALTAARALLNSTTPGFQPLQRALLDLSEHQLTRIEHTGTDVTRRPMGYGVRRPLRILVREARQSARGASRHPTSGSP